MASKKKLHKTKKKPLKKTTVMKKTSKGFSQTKKPSVKRVKELPKKDKPKPEEQMSDSDNGEDMLGMVDDEDINFLKNAITNRSYNIFNQIRHNSSEDVKEKSRKRKLEDELEINYEEHLHSKNDNAVVKTLLPIKTKDKIITRTIVEENQDIEDLSEVENDAKQSKSETDEFSFVNNSEFDPSIPITTAELLAKRSQILNEKKLHIGTLSAGLLENPEEKILNFKRLLELLDDSVPEVYMSLKKIVIISMLEVFKDLLPNYEIKVQDNQGVKFKKDTLKLQKYEEGLLLYYKKYLQKLEKFVSILFKKQGDKRPRTEGDLKLGELSLKAMCELLVTHPYFNYSQNIVQVVVPFLNNANQNVRHIVASSCKILFNEDKKEQITLKVLQILNQHLKKHAHNVHVEMLDILLHLKIKDVNLDQEKELEIKGKKLQSHKQNVLQLSKKERKRKKRLNQLEKELLETKAEENKQSKMKYLTEITKIIFGIYFRVLKSSTNTKVLGVCLEGLAKFAHCINVDYFIDLVNVLDNLLKEDWLGQREKLNCVLTVFVILSGVGEALNIDPSRFYVTLYNSMVSIHASKTHDNFKVLLKTLNDSLIKRRKKNTNKRMIGFVKRIATVSLQLLHNSTLSSLAVIKIMLQLNKSIDVLLDLDTSFGDGRYIPELEDAEYSNASSTALFELVPLSNHYHPLVSKYAQYIANGVPTTGNGVLPPEFNKLSPEELLQNYDMTQMAFNPPVPLPEKKSQSHKIKRKSKPIFADENFKNYCYEKIKEPLGEKSFFIKL